MPGAGRDPHHRRPPSSSGCARLGVEHELLDEGLERAGRRRSTAAPAGAATGSGSRPTSRSPAASTTTPARSSRPGSTATSRLGSICSGGRYDALASDGRTTYPGVGISLGVSRLLVPAGRPRGADRPAGRCPAPCSSRWSTRSRAPAATRSPARCGPAASRARSRPRPQKFGKQIRYAERRGIPFVWFPTAEGGHEVKDIRSGEQVDADPATWTPPAEDLRPQVVIDQLDHRAEEHTQ